MTVKLVAGTDVGSETAPAPWEDEIDGGRRILRAAMEASLRKVIAVGFDGRGEIYVASDITSAEETIGFLMRAVAFLQEHAKATSECAPNGGDA